MTTLLRTLATTSLFALAMAGCSHSRSEPSTTAQSVDPDAPARTADFKSEGSPASTAMSPRGARPIDLDDNEVADLIETINDGEVKMAKESLSVLSTPKARAFATRMASAHGDANRDLERFVDEKDIGTDGNAISSALESHVDDAIDEIKKDKDMADAIYMKKQILMHKAALTLIDCVAEPTIQHAEFVNYLSSSVRPAVAEHLSAAANSGPATNLDVSGNSDCAAVCGTTSALPPEVRDAACDTDSDKRNEPVTDKDDE